MINFKVEDFLSPDVIFIDADDTLQEASIKMKEYDCGMLPVGNKKHCVGVITDRDIIVRAASEGKDLTKEKVKDYLSPHVISCNVLDALEDGVEKMHDHKVSRLVVKNSFGEVKGILSFGNLLTKEAGIGEVANIVKHSLRKIAA